MPELAPDILETPGISETNVLVEAHTDLVSTGDHGNHGMVTKCACPAHDILHQGFADTAPLIGLININ